MQSAPASTSESDQWADLLESYFTIPLDDTTADLWWREVQADFKGATNAELCAAIRWGADERNWTRKHRPDLASLKLWMGICRKISRDADAIPTESCAHCSTGLIEVWPDLPRAPATEDDFIMAYSQTVPCACTAGMRSYRAHLRGSDLSLIHISEPTRPY